MAPGYAEGNVRTIIKAATQWGAKGSHRANRSRSNIINSLILSGMAATIGTLIMTGKPPKFPENRDEIRDLFKIDTGKKDEKNRRVMIDLLTYDKDYWDVVGNTFIGKPGKSLEALLKRSKGMSAPTALIVHDLVGLMQGKKIVDWKTDEIVEITDPLLKKIWKTTVYEIKRFEPISYSVYRRSRAREQSIVSGAITALLGYRPTLTEEDKRNQMILQKLYSYYGQKEELYQYLGEINRPRRHIDRYNRHVNIILDSDLTPRSMAAKWRPKLIIDLNRLLENKASYLASASRTPEEIEKTRRYLKNFGITQPQLVKLLDSYWKRQRKKTELSPLERHPVIGKSIKMDRLKERYK